MDTIEDIEVRVYRIATDAPESDATLHWDATTVVVVRVHADGETGLGYTYSDDAAATIVRGVLADLLRGQPASAPVAMWWRMLGAVRNLGRQGVVAHAISAVDVALWDLAARRLGVPLSVLWGGPVRDRVRVYGSGGFCSYDAAQLQVQLEGWRDLGIEQFKIKVGRRPGDDLARVRLARDVIGPRAQLFVDANGGYDRKQAVHFAHAFGQLGVTWLEEPVGADDPEGLRFVRDNAPAPVRVAAGEYGYHPCDFLRLLQAEAVDVLQADATRCLGYTGFLQVAALCNAWSMPLSGHTAPALHQPLGECVERLLHLEYFHDHVRIEAELFEGVRPPSGGALVHDPAAVGHGLRLRELSHWWES